MPDFERHLRSGVALHATLVALTCGGYFFALWRGNIVVFVTASLPATASGAIAPDIDHSSSRPYRWVQHYAPSMVALVCVGVLIPRHEGVATLVRVFPLTLPADYIAGFVSAATVIAVARAVNWLIPRIRPPHRTVLHRPTAGLVTAAVPIIIVLVVGQTVGIETGTLRLISAVCAGCYIAGFFVHLYLDGELSVLGLGSDSE